MKLTTKIMLGIGGVVVAIGIIITFFVTVKFTSILRLKQRSEGVTMANNLVLISKDMIKSRNYSDINELYDKMMDYNKGIKYIILFYKDKIIHNSSIVKMPLWLRTVDVNEELPHKIELIRTGNDIIQDISVLLPGKNGVLHIGMSDRYNRKYISSVIVNILRAISVILIIGLAGAYFLTKMLTKRISDLADAAMAVGRGNLEQKVSERNSDEVGRLGIAFNKMVNEIKQKNVIKSQLVGKIISAQEEERRRIARELHDRTSQSLTSLKIVLKSIESLDSMEEIKTNLKKFRSMLNSSLEEVHNLSVELRPTVLDDFGLLSAISNYTREISKGYNINVDLKVDKSYESKRFTSSFEIGVYRIVQEAILNICKHSHAKNVWINIEKKDSMFYLEIKDDGKGFNVEKYYSSPRTSLGIFGMSERSAILDGEFKIESEINKGTKISLKIPV